jgi:hypothetical protein
MTTRKGGGNGEGRTFDLDEFLDTPFFEPDKVLKDENSNPLLKKFAAFVLGDYRSCRSFTYGIFFLC